MSVSSLDIPVDPHDRWVECECKQKWLQLWEGTPEECPVCHKRYTFIPYPRKEDQ